VRSTRGAVPAFRLVRFPEPVGAENTDTVSHQRVPLTVRSAAALARGARTSVLMILDSLADVAADMWG
jgi:hypothetical protein